MKAVLSTVVLCTTLLFTGCDALSSNGADVSADAPVAYAHESNNRAELSGDGVTGAATVNYAKGAPSEWRSSVNVRGLDAGTYDFYVTLNGDNATLVCSFTAGGRQGCSADTDLPGFNMGEIRDSEGTVVASGTFARRGGTRVENAGRPALTASLTGAAEVPGPGDPDGSGTASVTLNQGQQEVCYEISVQDIDPATAAHIHEAEAGSAGPVIVGLAPPTSGTSSGCVSVDRRTIAEIAANPDEYYVNVHNPAYPAGAVRGQLSR